MLCQKGSGERRCVFLPSKNLTLQLAQLLTTVVVFIACPVTAQVQIARTGQELCFDHYESPSDEDPNGAPIDCEGTGQDGELRAGAPWPQPRFVHTFCDADGACASQDADCDNEETNDVMTDELTGLMWPVNGEVIPGEVTWSDALAQSQALTLCGHDDWHLPNRRELETLVSCGVADSMQWLEEQGFSDMMNSAWTSTTHVDTDYTHRAWFVELDDGTTYVSTKTGSGMPAFPVRIADDTAPAHPLVTGQTTCYDADGAEIDCAGTGQDGDVLAGAPVPDPRFTDHGDGTVTDEATNLMWLADANCLGTNYSDEFASGTADWRQALNAIQDINDGTLELCAAGYSDWRLPNRNELGSLSWYEVFQPALQPGHPFTNAPVSPSYNYWTSTSSGYAIDDPLFPYAWYVHFYDGMTDNSLKNYDEAFVWPVRGGLLGQDPESDAGVKDAGLDADLDATLDSDAGVEDAAVQDGSESAAPDASTDADTVDGGSADANRSDADANGGTPNGDDIIDASARDATVKDADGEAVDAGEDDDESESGCSCRTVGARSGRSEWGVFTALLFGIALAIRRRRAAVRRRY